MNTIVAPRRVRLLLIIALVAGGLAASCAARNVRDSVMILTANSDVNPVMQRYIDRGIGDAEQGGAKAVVIRLDTPGGQSDSMDKIVQRIQSAKVPVIVYVAPSGARAASAVRV